MMLSLSKCAEQLNSQIRLQVKDYQQLEVLEKQQSSLISKYIPLQEDVQILNQIESVILDSYLMLEEEEEISEIESDQVTFQFVTRVGCVTLKLINWKFFLENSNDHKQKSIMDMEELATSNVQLCRRMLDSENKSQWVESICELSHYSNKLMHLLDKSSKFLSDLQMCFLLNQLETSILSHMEKYTEDAEQSTEWNQYIVGLIKSLLGGCNIKDMKETIINCLFGIVKDSSNEFAINTLIEIIQSIPNIMEDLSDEYKLHYAKMEMLYSLNNKHHSSIDAIYNTLQQLIVPFNKSNKSKYNSIDFTFMLVVQAKIIVLCSSQQDFSIKASELVSLIENAILQGYSLTIQDLSCILKEFMNSNNNINSKDDEVRKNKLIQIQFQCLSAYSKAIGSLNRGLRDNQLKEVSNLFCSLIHHSNQESITDLEQIKECIKIIAGNALPYQVETINLKQLIQCSSKVVIDILSKLISVPIASVRDASEIVELLLLMLQKKQMQSGLSPNNRSKYSQQQLSPYKKKSQKSPIKSTANSHENLSEKERLQLIEELSCLGMLCEISISSEDEQYNSSRKQTFFGNISDTKRNYNWKFLPQIFKHMLKRESISKELFSKLLNQLLTLSNNSDSLNNNPKKQLQKTQQEKQQYHFEAFKQKPEQLQPLQQQFLIGDKDCWKSLGIIAMKNVLLEVGDQTQLLDFYISIIEQRFEEYLKFFLQNCMVPSNDNGSLSLSICTPIIRRISIISSTESNLSFDLFLSNMSTLFHIIDLFYLQRQSQVQQENNNLYPLEMLISKSEMQEIDEIFQRAILEQSVANNTNTNNNNKEQKVLLISKLSHYRLLIACLPSVFASTNMINCKNYNESVTDILKSECVSNNLFQPLLCSLAHHVSLLEYIQISSHLHTLQFNDYQLKQIHELTDSLEQAAKISLQNSNNNNGNSSSCISSNNDMKKEEISMREQLEVFSFLKSCLQQRVPECLQIIERCTRYYPQILLLFAQIAKTHSIVQVLPIIAQHHLLLISAEGDSSFSFELLLDLIESLPQLPSPESCFTLLKTVFSRLIIQDNISKHQKRSLKFLLTELKIQLEKMNSNCCLLHEIPSLLESLAFKK